MRTYLFFVFLSSSFLMAQESLPFHTISELPKEFNPGNTLARSIEGLGFRYYWATYGLTENEWNYRPSPEAKSLYETLEHISSLSETIKNSVQGKNTLRPYVVPPNFDKLRSTTLLNLEKARNSILNKNEDELSQLSISFEKDGKTSEFSFWNLYNGPLADVLYHTGQIVSFRRTAGNPIPRGVNVFLGIKN